MNRLLPEDLEYNLGYKELEELIDLAEANMKKGKHFFRDGQSLVSSNIIDSIFRSLPAELNITSIISPPPDNFYGTSSVFIRLYSKIGKWLVAHPDNVKHVYQRLKRLKKLCSKCERRVVKERKVLRDAYDEIVLSDQSPLQLKSSDPTLSLSEFLYTKKYSAGIQAAIDIICGYRSNLSEKKGEKQLNDYKNELDSMQLDKFSRIKRIGRIMDNFLLCFGYVIKLERDDLYNIFHKTVTSSLPVIVEIQNHTPYISEKEISALNSLKEKFIVASYILPFVPYSIS